MKSYVVDDSETTQDVGGHNSCLFAAYTLGFDTSHTIQVNNFLLAWKLRKYSVLLYYLVFLSVVINAGQWTLQFVDINIL